MTTHFLSPMITVETALRAVEISLRVGERHGAKVAVTVVDTGLSLVAYARADGMTPHSSETSRRKAATAASTRRPSALLPAEFAPALEHGTGGLLSRIPGGVPIVFDGVLIGGLGIAGGPPPIDAAIAEAVLAELGADPLPDSTPAAR